MNFLNIINLYYYLNSNAYFVVSYADLCVSENELAFFLFVSSTAIFQRIWPLSSDMILF